MSQALEGIQFPINSTNNKPSTSKTGQAILSEALSTVDHKTSQQVLSEKNWRKKYPIYGGVLKSMLTLNEAIIDVKEG